MTPQEVTALSDVDFLNYVQKLLSEHDAAIKAHPFQLYEPFTQKHLAVHLDTSQTRFIVGGNRAGKSWISLIELIWDLVGWWPEWYPPENRAPQPCRVRIVSTPKALRNRIEGFLKQWIPRQLIVNFDRRLGILQVDNGQGDVNVCELMSFDMDIQSFAGNSQHKCVIDEHLPKKEIYDECRMRLLDVNGKMTVNICPWIQDVGGGFTWEYDDLYLPAKLGKNPGLTCHEFTIYDNPLLTKESIEDELKGKTAEEREAREFGRFIRIGGIIFHEYHDTAPWMIPNKEFNLDDKDRREWWTKNARVIWSIDPAATRENAVLAVGVIGRSVFCVDEIFANCPPKELADRMKLLEKYTGHPDAIVYDFAADVDEKTSGVSFIDVLREQFSPAFYRWKKSPKFNEEAHIAVIKQMFIKEESSGLPRIRVTERCRRLRWELGHWGRTQTTGLPEKKGNDEIDNLRYICATLPGEQVHEVYEPAWMREARERETPSPIAGR